MSSSGAWLTPPVLGTKIIPIGTAGRGSGRRGRRRWAASRHARPEPTAACSDGGEDGRRRRPPGARAGRHGDGRCRPAGGRGAGPGRRRGVRRRPPRRAGSSSRSSALTIDLPGHHVADVRAHLEAPAGGHPHHAVAGQGLDREHHLGGGGQGVVAQVHGGGAGVVGGDRRCAMSIAWRPVMPVTTPRHGTGGLQHRALLDVQLDEGVDRRRGPTSRRPMAPGVAAGCRRGGGAGSRPRRRSGRARPRARRRTTARLPTHAVGAPCALLVGEGGDERGRGADRRRGASVAATSTAATTP